MRTKTYYAIQDKQESGIGRKLVKAPPVLHEFSTKRMRDEWVRRGGHAGRSHRRAISAAEGKGIAAPVRHWRVDAEVTPAGKACEGEEGAGNA